jgi:hypothetical protein
MLAQIIRVGGVEHDLLQLIGLLIAGGVLAILLVWRLRGGQAKGQRLISTLAVLGIATIGWSAIEAAIRIAHALADQWH